jgi:steroid 5-alpha reductase family enzyme
MTYSKDRFQISRGLSFLIIGLIYVIASAAGILIYRGLSYHFALDLLIADAAATFLVFVFSVVLRNSSVYDPYWSVAPVVIVIYASCVNVMDPVRALMLAAVCIWGVRLTANWAYTFGGLAYQDWRYTKLEGDTGKFYPLINLLGIHMFPTLVVYGCILPAVFVFRYDASFGPLNVLGFAISLCAVVMQGTADLQMHRYRLHRDTPLIRTGLWKWSRHPNYLGEILMWWGVGISAVSSMPDRPYLLIGALVNTLMFLAVSIPLADGRQSGKPGFDEYKAETRMLLPLPKHSS